MELQRYWRTARRWFWLIVLFGIISGLTAGAYSYQLPKAYVATATALVNPSQAALPTTAQGTFDLDQLVQTYVSLILVAPVKDNIPRFASEVTRDQVTATSIAALREPSTTLVDINVYARDPYVAFAVARAVVPAFNAALDQLQQQAPGAADRTSQLQALVAISAPTAAPTVPIAPQPLRDGFLGFAVGLVLGASLAFLLEYLDNTLKQDVDVPARLGLPLLGAMPLHATGGHRREDVALITQRDPRDPVAESFRAVRTNLLFSSLGRDLKTIVVTSTIPSEGKTSVAANLAVAMAQAGSQVILVDADFRRPDLDKVFRKRENVGLGNLILGEHDEEQLIQATDVPNLRVVCSGPTPPNPSELLGSTSMARVTERLLQLGDVVIFDSPPVSAVTDPAVLAAHADGVVLVVERGRTPVPQVIKAVASLKVVGANVVGVVLNKVPPGEGYLYYDYGKRPEKKGRGKKAQAPASPETLRPAMPPRAAGGAEP